MMPGMLKNSLVNYQTMGNGKFLGYINKGILVFISSAILLLGANKLYRSQAEVHHCDDVKIQKIDTTFNQYSEMTMPNKAYRIMTDSVDYPIDIPAKIWDTTIREGDTVSIEYRRDFPLWGKEFDGLSIDDGK